MANDLQMLFDKAHKAGMAAGMAHNPTPMIVSQHSNPLNDHSPVVKQYYVSGGVCGFASIHLISARTAFAKWVMASGNGRKDYQKGANITCFEFGQSMERKEAYAHAFAKVLRDAGIDCYAQSRMD